MNTTCNYRCSYCTQRFVDDRKQWASDLPAFIAAFTGLPGDWEIKLSGGEPFQHPRFIETVRALAEGGMRVSVVTNLSASDSELADFAEATSTRPGLLSASLHLEFCKAEEFTAKLLRFASGYDGRVVVTCVATRENLEQMDRIKASIEKAGLRFAVQPEKQDREVIDYSPAERGQLIELGGHNGTGWIAPDLSGRGCWAGVRYFIVDHRGEAYRCYPARRYRKERLGNLLDGSLRLGDSPVPCAYSYCNCTVPQQRGMVSLQPPRKEIQCSPDA